MAGSGVAEQVLPLPRGGGAVRGIGETFQADAQKGTGRFSVPITFPAGRGGFQPRLALTYGTGEPNGPFGLGWSLNTAAISLRTAKGIPRYRGTDEYLLSGAETLVHVGDEPRGRRYRPRVDGLFARILQIGDHWEVTARNGLTSLYGTDDTCRIRNGDRPDEVFAWLLSETRDPNGNHVGYAYRREDNQLYLVAIRYARYSVEFEYGERPDPFSTYRSGFEIRTTRRCEQILIKADDVLIRSYRLRYVTDDMPLNLVSLLAGITMTGHRTDSRGRVLTRSMPPLTFGYTAFRPGHASFETFSADGGDGPDRALDHEEYELVDLHGGGLPDVVHTSAEGVRYWRNLGECRFARPRPMTDAPAGITLADDGVRFADMDGTGSADLLVTKGPLNGYFPTEFEARWATMVRPRRAPAIDLTDPAVALVDMDGDGRVDALDTGGHHMVVAYNRGADGWAEEVTHVARGPLPDFTDVVLSAPDRRVRLAAMSGDLQDLVTIHDRRVEYWPNLGYGRWGRRITMRGSPELPRDYDPARLFLADIDGDGYADLIYVGFDEVRYWINQSGNGWSERQVVRGTPAVRDIDVIRTADMKGTGTAGLLWTADRQGGGYRYLDFTEGTKPYLLNVVDGHVGATTRIEYAPSTAYFCADLAAGWAWATRLPFPVQVVARVKTVDRLSGGRRTIAYRYRDGHWDGREREFRGFARVDQTDSETFEEHPRPGPQAAADGVPREAGRHFSPPTMTRTWYHVGRGSGRPAEARALWGAVLRTELAELGAPDRPYVITEHRYQVRTVAPDVHVPVQGESVTRQTERSDTARVTRLIFEHDDHGNVTRQIRVGDAADPLVVVTDTAYADSPGGHVKDRPAETLIRLPSAADRAILRDYLDGGREPDWTAFCTVDAEVLGRTRHHYDGVDYVGLPVGEVERGNLTRTESLVLTDASIAALYPDPASGGHPRPPEALADLAGLGYAREADGWWARTVRNRWDRRFGLIVGVLDAMGNETTIDYDEDHHLFPVRVTDAAGHAVSVESIDLQALAPRLVRDANGNLTEYAFDPLGLLTATAVKGKPLTGGRWEGDTLGRPTTRYAYDLHAFDRDGSPIAAAVWQRAEHGGDRLVRSLEYYDGMGRSLQRKVTAEPAAPGGPARWAVSGRQVYNDKGWLVERYEPFFSTTSAYEPVTGAGVPTVLGYDPLGRPTVQVNPDGSFRRVVIDGPWRTERHDENDTGARRYEADGRLVERTNAEVAALKIGDHLDTPKVEIADVWGRLTESIEDGQPTRYAYDPLDRLLTVTDPYGRQVLSYGYDLLGRRVRTRHLDAGTRIVVLDAAGSVAESGDSKGARTITSYDVLGRPVQVRARDGASRPFTLREWHLYDRLDGVTAEQARRANQLGRLVRSYDGAGQITVESYDLNGEPARKNRRMLPAALLPAHWPDSGQEDLLEPGPGYPVGTGYDAMGNLTELAYPDGSVARYAYNEAGLLERITLGDRVCVAGVDYNARGERTVIRYGNGVVTGYAYEPLTCRLLRLTTRDALGGTIQDLEYAYDPIGNVIGIIDHVPTGPGHVNNTREHSYDALYRLTSAEGASYRRHYDYDRVSNIVAESSLDPPWTSVHTYRPGTNLLLTRDATAFDHDAGGNMTRMGTLRLDWDHADRMVGAGQTSYAYDSAGLRVRKVAEARETRYLDGVFEERTDRTVAHVVDAGRRIAVVTTTAGHASITFHHGDHLGSTNVTTGEDGRPTGQEEFAPYGETSLGAGDTYRYAGKEFDEETGLYYFGARYYCPRLGRWISADPLALVTPDASNPYLYVRANPIKFTDLIGLEEKNFTILLSPSALQRNDSKKERRVAETIAQLSTSYAERHLSDAAIIVVDDLPGAVAKLAGQLGPDDTIGRVVIITHGLELTNRQGRTVESRVWFPLNSGKEHAWQSPQSLAAAARSPDLRLDLRTLQQKSTDQTTISFIGCNIGTSKPTLTAVGRFFGGRGVWVEAPATGAALEERTADTVFRLKIGTKTYVDYDSVEGRRLMTRIQVDDAPLDTRPAVSDSVLRKKDEEVQLPP
ncbi:SpvB/TcaC N-terminal domain-containing protein [Microbispora sp. ZYX-F-249]|uniref:SpvB/TcaC N-terminal domain-containing protein n=1 Tax=Microbispora maris TaxID=3144104 RepID=A0ABV0AXH3_9ACTN